MAVFHVKAELTACRRSAQRRLDERAPALDRRAG